MGEVMVWRVGGLSLMVNGLAAAMTRCLYGAVVNEAEHGYRKKGPSKYGYQLELDHAREWIENCDMSGRAERLLS